MLGLGLAWLVAFVLWVWMMIRVWRDSALLGVACLLIPGAFIFALIKNWGDPDSDIKVPFFLSILVGVWVYFAAINMVEEEYGVVFDPVSGEFVLDDAELTPAMDDQGGELSGPEDASVASTTTAGSFPATPSGASPASTEDALPLEEQRRRDRQAARSVRLHRGPIELGPAYTRLQTPSHFGFLSAKRIIPLARLHNRESSTAILGWIVHERVKLADDQAWFAEVRFDAVGHLQLEAIGSSVELWSAIRAHPDAELAPVHGEGLFGPVWMSERRFALWQRNLGDGAVEAVATIPLRHGVLSYVVRVPDSSERELAMRTARLLASKCEVEDGWRHQDAPADSPAKGPTLAEWIVESSIVAPVESPTGP